MPAPEMPPAPEQSRETAEQPEWKPEFLEHEPNTPTVPPPVPAATPEAPTAPESLFVKEVEQVLSDGLEDTYQKLDPATQAQFRSLGEATAEKVAGLLEQTKVQTKKILDLIVNWLKIIPGVNQFFLEQEAKIKTDKLLALRQPHDPHATRPGS